MEQRNRGIHPSKIEHQSAAFRLHTAIDSLRAIEGMAKSHYSPKSHPLRARCDKALVAVRWLQAELANVAVQEYPGEGLANAYTTAKRAGSVDLATATLHAVAGMGDEIGLD